MNNWNSAGNGLFWRRCKDELYDKVTIYSGRLPGFSLPLACILSRHICCYSCTYLVTREYAMLFLPKFVFLTIGRNIEDILPSYRPNLYLLSFLYFMWYSHVNTILGFFKNNQGFILLYKSLEQCTSLLSNFPYLWFRLVTLSFEVYIYIIQYSSRPKQDKNL